MMVLMERCSPARRRRPAAATEAAAAALGGAAATAALGAAAALGGSGSLAPILPCGWCCNGAGSPLQDGGSGGGKFVALGDLGFLSLYRLSDSRHQILGLSKWTLLGRPDSDLDEFYIQKHRLEIPHNFRN